MLLSTDGLGTDAVVYMKVSWYVSVSNARNVDAAVRNGVPVMGKKGYKR